MSATTGQRRTDLDEEYDNFFEDMFNINDFGPESHRIINGKRCVYWAEGMWISKEGLELDERK